MTPIGDHLDVVLKWKNRTVNARLRERPSLWVDELKQPDGSYRAGSHYWNILGLHFDKDEYLWGGERQDVTMTIIGKPTEEWKLHSVSQVSNGRAAALCFGSCKLQYTPG